MKKSTELKAQVYDLIAEVEHHQGAINKLQQQIRQKNEEIAEALQDEAAEKENAPKNLK